MDAATISDLEDLSNCGICLEPFTNPKALTCLHTFCCECLKTLAGDSASNVTCPFCKKITQIPGSDVENLPTDFRMRQIYDVLKRINSHVTKSDTDQDRGNEKKEREDSEFARILAMIEQEESDERFAREYQAQLCREIEEEEEHESAESPEYPAASAIGAAAEEYDRRNRINDLAESIETQSLTVLQKLDTYLEENNSSLSTEQIELNNMARDLREKLRLELPNVLQNLKPVGGDTKNEPSGDTRSALARPAQQELTAALQSLKTPVVKNENGNTSMGEKVKSLSPLQEQLKMDLPNSRKSLKHVKKNDQREPKDTTTKENSANKFKQQLKPATLNKKNDRGKKVKDTEMDGASSNKPVKVSSLVGMFENK